MLVASTDAQGRPHRSVLSLGRAGSKSTLTTDSRMDADPFSPYDPRDLRLKSGRPVAHGAREAIGKQYMKTGAQPSAGAESRRPVCLRSRREFAASWLRRFSVPGGCGSALRWQK